MKPTPPKLTGLTVLDKSKFVTNQAVMALLIKAQDSKRALTQLKEHGLLSISKLPSIIPAPLSIENSKQKRLVLLDPKLTKPVLEGNSEIQFFIKSTNAQVIEHEIALDYDFWTTEQILRSILPTELDIPSSFTQVGHIAHFNLRPEYQPYKALIGQVILDKIRNVETVVNKIDTIDNKFRVFAMELLAGKPDFITTQKESDCRFKFDFSKVYWNSRLQSEHKRLFCTFKKNEIVCDVMAGVGPFAIPASKNGVYVFANDLNPSSYQYLTENIALNKAKTHCKSFNLDGREFIKKSLDIVADEKIWHEFEIEGHILSKTRRFANKDIPVDQLFSKPTILYPQHYVMNLPDTAIEFLDAFNGLFCGRDIKPEHLPWIHVYCFSKADDSQADAIQVISFNHRE